MLLAWANPLVTADPVPPYGLERVARTFALAGCDVEAVFPFFEPDPAAAFRAALDPPPALVGLSLRNLDDALVVRGELGPGPVDTTGALAAVRPLVAAALDAVGPDRVLVGGTGLSAGPVPVLRALGARLGVRGPADDLAWLVGRRLALGVEPPVPVDHPRVVALPRDEDPDRPHASPRPGPRAWDGWAFPPGPTPRTGPFLGLVLARGGRVPVEVAAGCDRRCAWCIEGRLLGGRVRPRPLDDVLGEIDALRAAGVRRFWLAAAEINAMGLRRAKALLRGVAERDVDVRFFAAPTPVDDEFLDLAAAAGVDPADVSWEFGHLDDRVLAAGGGPARRRHVDRLVDLYLRRGHRTLGGSLLLGGHPAETEDTVEAALDAALDIDHALPAGFGLSYACGARLYPETDLADHVAARWEEERAHLWTPDGRPPDPSLAEPVVYCRPLSPRELLARVRERLAGARGEMEPMNDEAANTPARIEAEALVNRGLWRLEHGRLDEALACFQAAERAVPGHLEALAQQAMLLANRLDRPGAARAALARLEAALPPGDPRREEVARAVARLAERDR